ncbi:MAG TPA: phage tail protein [Chloroflexia bacterium]|nr:phage tail protein [Chloroflexia bacterium]
MPLMGGSAGEKKDPLVQANFYVSVDGHLDNMVFRECSGLGSEQEVVEYKGSMKDDYHSIRQVPGRLKWQVINLKRGITDSMDAWKWRKLVEDGMVDQARANGSIVMVDQMGTEVARWNFIRAWPKAISGPSLNSSTNEVGVEELQIVHEKLERIK